jgi:hypothetical protein
MNKSFEEAAADLAIEILQDTKRTIDVIVAAIVAEKALKDGEAAECVREGLRLALL